MPKLVAKMKAPISRRALQQVCTQKRSLFEFGPKMKSSTVQSYGEQRIIGYAIIKFSYSNNASAYFRYTDVQMFDVVHTVAEYPQFVPCKCTICHYKLKALKYYQKLSLVTFY